MAIWIEQGGWCLWLLILMSMISISIGLFKCIQFLWFGIGNKTTYDAWMNTLSEHSLSRFQSNTWKDGYIVNTVGNFAIEQAKKHSIKSDYEMAIGHFAGQQIERFRGGLKGVEVISIVSPLIGLLGTVLGMIDAFEQLRIAGSNVDPSLLSAGISKALLTTAGGLCVAIPALILWHFFDRLIEKCQVQLESVLSEIAIRTNWNLE